MRFDWRIRIVWACCIVRLLFYASMMPLWEGFDEWAHFGVIRAVAWENLLPGPDTRIPRDVEASLQIAPLPWAQRNLPPPSLPHDAFWVLTATQQSERAAAFYAMPRQWAAQAGNLPAYETQQPPLYYWLMAPALVALR